MKQRANVPSFIYLQAEPTLWILFIKHQPMLPPLHQLNSRLRLLDPLQQQTIQKRLKEHHPVDPSRVRTEGRTSTTLFIPEASVIHQLPHLRLFDAANQRIGEFPPLHINDSNNEIRVERLHHG